MAPLPAHGTRARYVHRTAPCCCGLCRQGNARYMVGWKAGKTALRHDWYKAR